MILPALYDLVCRSEGGVEEKHTAENEGVLHRFLAHRELVGSTPLTYLIRSVILRAVDNTISLCLACLSIGMRSNHDLCISDQMKKSGFCPGFCAINRSAYFF